MLETILSNSNDLGTIFLFSTPRHFKQVALRRMIFFFLVQRLDANIDAHTIPFTVSRVKVKAGPRGLSDPVFTRLVERAGGAGFF